MNKTILHITDTNTATGFREASFEEIMDAARKALAHRVRKGTLLSSPKATADYLRARLATLDYEIFTVVFLDLCGAAVYAETLHYSAALA